MTSTGAPSRDTVEGAGPGASAETADVGGSGRQGIVLVVALAVLVAAMIGTVLVVQARRNADAELAARRAAVEQRGQHVMPFDQDRTTHAFAKTDTGGTETVTANDPNDTTQVTLIQQHLAEEQARFARGDFSDPAAIHGGQMPGLAALAAGAVAGDLAVSFDTVPGGGRLTYTAKTAALVDAVHQFFDAQVADHGSHATG